MFDYDQVDIVCPQPPRQSIFPNGTPTDQQTSSEQERYIIYNVSKEEYDMCRIINDTPRIIAVCDAQQQQASSATSTASAQQSQNNKSKYFTVTFRSFTPQPRGLEFKPGQDYYFISTLAGQNGDSDKRFSPCKEHNMKVIFKVCCKPPPSSTPSLSTLLSSGSSSSDASLASAGPLNLSPALSADGAKRQAQKAAPLQPAAGNADRLTLAANSTSFSSLLLGQQQQQQQPHRGPQKEPANFDSQAKQAGKPWPSEQTHYTISTMPSNQLPNTRYSTGYNGQPGFSTRTSNINYTIKPKYQPHPAMAANSQPMVPISAPSNQDHMGGVDMRQQQPATVLPIEEIPTPSQVSPTTTAQQHPVRHVTPPPPPMMPYSRPHQHQHIIHSAPAQSPHQYPPANGPNLSPIREPQQQQPDEVFATLPIDPRYLPTPLPPFWRNPAPKKAGNNNPWPVNNIFVTPQNQQQTNRQAAINKSNGLVSKEQQQFDATSSHASGLHNATHWPLFAICTLVTAIHLWLAANIPAGAPNRRWSAM